MGFATDESTANLNHILALNFLDTMLRRSAKDVSILHHAMKRIAVMDIKNLNLALAQYYESLDDYTKMEAGRAFGLMQIAVKQTARDFYTELEGVVSALEKNGLSSDTTTTETYLLTCLLRAIS